MLRLLGNIIAVVVAAVVGVAYFASAILFWGAAIGVGLFVALLLLRWLLAGSD